MDLRGLFAVAQSFADIILWILVLCSVSSIAVILERFFTLSKVARQNKVFRKKANELIVNGSTDAASLTELAANAESLPERALKYGMDHTQKASYNGLDELFNSFMIIEKKPLERSLNFLATIGSNAPFIGLLGTVMGIMKAFNDLAQNSAAGNEVVMMGIAHALIATAIGLFVAIPAVIAFNYYQKMVKDTVLTVEIAKELCIVNAKRPGA